MGLLMSLSGLATALLFVLQGVETYRLNVRA
jgi:hypothetical protein